MRTTMARHIDERPHSVCCTDMSCRGLSDIPHLSPTNARNTVVDFNGSGYYDTAGQRN